MKTHLKLLSLLLLTLFAVSTTIAGEEKPKPNFSGVLWATYWHAVTGGPAATNLATSTNGTANSFDIKRVYLNAAGNLDEAWSWKVTFEMGGTPTLWAFAKTAMVKWDMKAPVSHSLSFGLIPTLTWGTPESYWGYRVVMNAPRESLAKSVVGANKGLSTGASADFGVTWNVKPVPMAAFALQVANGAGFKTPEGNMHKKISLTAAVMPVPKSVIELYYETEAGYTDGTDKVNRTGLGIFAGYKVEQFGLGVDYFQKNFDDKHATDDVISNVVSIFGNYALNEKIRLLGRFDSYGLSDEKYLGTDFGGKAGESLIIVGADCSYGPPNTHFIVTYQQTMYDAQIQDGANWVDRDSYGALVMDWTISF